MREPGTRRPGLIATIALGVLLPLGLFWFMRPGPPDESALREAIGQVLRAELPFRASVTSIDKTVWDHCERRSFAGNVTFTLTFDEPVFREWGGAERTSHTAAYIDVRETLRALRENELSLPGAAHDAFAAKRPGELYPDAILVYPLHAKGERLPVTVPVRGTRDGRLVRVENFDAKRLAELRPAVVAANRYAVYAKEHAVVNMATPEFARACEGFAEAVRQYATFARVESGRRSLAALHHTLRPGAMYFHGHYGVLIEWMDPNTQTVKGREIFLLSANQRAVTGRFTLGDPEKGVKPSLELFLPSGEKACEAEVGENLLHIRMGETQTWGTAFPVTPEELQKTIKEADLPPPPPAGQ